MTKKIVLLSLLILLAYPLVSGALYIEQKDRGSTVVADTDNPAKFTLFITNNGPSDYFEIYSLLGVSFSPKGTFYLESGKATPVEVEAYLPKDMLRNNRGYVVFDYEIKSPSSGITKDKFQVKIVDLENAIAIDDSSIYPGENNVDVVIRNVERAYLRDVHIRFKSSFFDTAHTVTLGPLEAVNVTLQLDEAKLKKLGAGTYDLEYFVETDDASAELTSSIKYLERGGISVSEKTSGWIIRKTITQKTNEGNVPTMVTINSSESILTRLFTDHDPRPTLTTKSGVLAYYSWQQEVAPGESLTITTTTNYTFPFILILLIIVAVVLVKVLTTTTVELTKRVSFVKTRGGELALKVRIHVKARSHIDNIQIVDRVPGSMKLYTQSGIQPDKFDERTGRLNWNISRLNAGEERVFSYIVYSKLHVVGKLELPSATAVFEREGKTHEVFSNKTFFVAETAHRE